jgi:hypothetical protein
MTTDEAKERILEQWRALPSEQRQTPMQASLFALKMKSDYRFEAGNCLAIIVGWLLQEIN